MSKIKVSRLEILDKINDFSEQELSSFIDDGIISIEDIYIGAMMERIWNSDDKGWPRA